VNSLLNRIKAHSAWDIIIMCIYTIVLDALEYTGDNEVDKIKFAKATSKALRDKIFDYYIRSSLKDFERFVNKELSATTNLRIMAFRVRTLVEQIAKLKKTIKKTIKRPCSRLVQKNN